MAGHEDSSFGPVYVGKFDFTLRFEHIILTILPASILIAIYPILLYHYSHKPVVVGRSWSLHAKLAAAICWLGLEVASLVLWTHQSDKYSSNFAIVASALSCTAVCCIISFLHVEHCHSLQPSSLLSIYLTLNILFDATKARSCFSRAGDLNAIGSMLAAAATLKGIIVLLEELPKKEHILDRPQQPYGSEATSGFWGRALFIWVNKTLFAGYRNILDVEDLEPLGPEFSTTHLSSLFDPVWARFQRKTSSHRLMKALLWSLYQPVCAIILPRLCYTAFYFSQALLIQRIILYINDEHASVDLGRGLIGATVLIYLGIAISKAIYMHLNYRLVTLARGILVEHILAKSLRIDYSEASKRAALTHMDTDIEGLATGLPVIHDIWISFIEVGIGAYLLTRVVGRASFLVAVPVIASTIISMFVAKRMVPARKAWNDVIQYRVSETASLLAYTKGMKMLAIEPPVISYIQGLRVEELKRSKPFRILSLMFNTTALTAQCLTPVAVLGGFVFWVSPSHRLTAAEAFTCLSIITLISDPLMNILRCGTLFSPALGCVQRIETFLILNERKDCRTEAETASLMGEKDATSISSQHRTASPPAYQNTIFIRGNLVCIKSQTGNSIIHNASFSIRRSTLTVVTGPVASGKSLLLRALLGEVSFQGTIEFSRLDSLISYCDQVPWIRNLSIRENIIGEQPFDPIWYESVLNACLLGEDLSQQLHGDETLAGSDGANLSGGQKQRIALARALYIRAPVAMFDDVLSGLDRTMSATISHQVFGPNGLLRRLGTTVIMTSHSLLHASLADKILFLDGAGNIETRGVPQRLSFTDSTLLAALQHDGAGSLRPEVEKAESCDSILTQEKAKNLGAMEAQEDRTLRRKGDMSLYYFYFRSSKKWVALVWIVLLTVAAIAQQVPPIYLRIWLEVAPNNNLYFIGFALLSLFSCFMCAALFLFFHLCAVPGSSNSLHKMLLESVMGATLSFLTETDSGAILNRFSQDMNLVSQQLPTSFQFFLLMASGIITAGVLVSGARFFALILPLLFVILYTVQHFYLRTSRQIRYLDLEAKTPLYTHITETATGLYSIRASRLSSKVLEAGSDLLKYSQKPFYYMFCIQRWLTLTLDLMAVGIAATLVALGVLLPSTTSQTGIGLSLLNMISIGSECTLLIEVWTRVETSLGALVRIRSFLKYTPQESETEGTMIPPPSWPDLGHIVFNNLTASYSSTDVPTRVLHNISLEIRAGQKAVIIGRSGSGKSSLILALLNFLEHSGSVCIDGIDITKMPRRILRSRITTITQDALKLDGSLRNNLLPFLYGKSEETLRSHEGSVIAMLCRVRLWDHIAPYGGLDAAMLDLNFSVGQLQLLSIARAALHQKLTGTNIVLMDEPTSSLDLDTDRYIQKEIFSDLFGHCTVIMVAHRLETKAKVAMVVEMAEGTIIRVTQQ